ncbi:hypothetical protein [Pelagirhabdus alkalitolerans]|uniref:hypothetical protein n=1 Tax=Pelagirhabdus alkalitolerans TaxID=1612202 RepID=UPI001C40A8B7|nr:hypothetical protein [Pelagirhabdus alkalitolerans]
MIIECYTDVRKSASDSNSQVGAFHELDNAKELADSERLNVYDQTGKLIYSSGSASQAPVSSPDPSPVPANKNNTSYTGASVVDYLNLSSNSHLGDSSLANRKKLAVEYKIVSSESQFSGTGKQNTDLLNALRGGSKPVSTPAPKPAVKSIDQLAQEVIDGKHGTGDARRKLLGSQYNVVQARVNQILSGSTANASAPKKSISQMATEVLRGDHGDGHKNRRESLGISQSEYEKVRAEVNRRA